MNMNNENLKLQDYYSTTDLALATAISLFFPLEKIDKTTNSYKAQFLFRRSEKLDQFIETVWKNELKVSPLAYFSQLKNIKARLYASK
ncbi:MAG: hypothetical protein H0W89_07850 [Candidatus Levybacteria bacterium]|nr:hypothetical protein [Candidatus Levybacteria bacterium]